MVDIVLHLSRQVPLYFSAQGFDLWHFDSKRICDESKLHVDCHKRFPVSMYQVACVGCGSTNIDRGVGTRNSREAK